MNDHIAPILRDALNGSFPQTREPEVESIHLGGTMLESANDEPKYIRTPELDKRVERGDFCNGNAFHEVATGQSRMFCVGFDPNGPGWLPIVERSEVTR